jgi:hypothetical protein
MKISKFLLCENPLTESGDFILHTRTPRFLMQVIDCESAEHQKEIGKELFIEGEKHGFMVASQTNIYDYYFVLVAIHIYDDIKNTQENADELAKIARRAADWYRQIIKREIDLSNES